MTTRRRRLRRNDAGGSSDGQALIRAFWRRSGASGLAGPVSPQSGQWWAGLFSGLALLPMVLGLNFVGDDLQDISDRRTQGD